MKILIGSKNFEMQRTSVVKEPKKCANYRTENAEFQCSYIQTKMKDHFGSNANIFHSLPFSFSQKNISSKKDYI